MSSKSIVLVVLPIEFCRESRRFHLEFCRESRCFRVKFSTLKIPVVSKLRLFTGLRSTEEYGGSDTSTTSDGDTGFSEDTAPLSHRKVTPLHAPRAMLPTPPTQGEVTRPQTRPTPGQGHRHCRGTADTRTGVHLAAACFAAAVTYLGISPYENGW